MNCLYNANYWSLEPDNIFTVDKAGDRKFLCDSYRFFCGGNYSRTIFLSLLIVLTGLFSGCASKQRPLTLYPNETRPRALHHIAPSHRAAYNRPYKVKGKTYYPIASAQGYSEVGIASWYGSESGNLTSMGTRFKPHGYTAAHKTLPLPSKVRVTNLHNGRSIIVLVNDRGPFKKNRLIDLSHGAAKKIGLRGLARVKVEYLDNLAENN